MSLSLSLSFTLFLLLLNVHVHSEPHFHFTNELCLHCTIHQLMHIRTVHASYCATLPYNDAHRSGGFSFGRALKQEYFGVPAFFLRDHGLPRFDSFLHTPGASARPPRALHYNPPLAHRAHCSSCIQYKMLRTQNCIRLKH